MHQPIADLAGGLLVRPDYAPLLEAQGLLDARRLELAAAEAGSRATDVAQAASCEAFRNYLQKQMDTVNATLPRSWTIKKFVVLPGELSIEKGELTPTMKLKRRVIHAKYADEIEGLYQRS